MTAIVPAKQESRRLREKNWRPFNPNNMLSLAEGKLHQALECSVDRVILSIDFDPKRLPFWIKKAAESEPDRLFIRRRPFGLKEMTSADVVLDALDFVGSHGKADTYYLLQPTSPFVTKPHILEMIALVSTSGGNVIAVNPAYKPCGAFYGGYQEHIRQYGDFYRPKTKPFVLDWKESIDIDHLYDFEIARGLV